MLILITRGATPCPDCKGPLKTQWAIKNSMGRAMHLCSYKEDFYLPTVLLKQKGE
jgi:hypothetical protein